MIPNTSGERARLKCAIAPQTGVRQQLDEVVAGATGQVQLIPKAKRDYGKTS